MMTSVSNDRSRSAWEKTQISATQAVQPQKQIVQATAEQMRLAQVIFDKNDSDFEAQVKQLMEVTGKNQDECIVALHDCNGDVNKAINLLLEGNSDTTSWETVGGRKKNFGKESSENKENREKRSEREASCGHGNNDRKGRGGNRGRVFKGEENGIDCNQGDRSSDRGKRARGRGGFGRVRGRGTGRFSTQGMGTFNPADYSDSPSTYGCGTKPVIWEVAQNGGEKQNELASNADSVAQNLPNISSYGLKGTWKNSVEEWTTEDWIEDLSETKVFTASSVPAENHVMPGQSIDLVALLQKPALPSQVSEVNSFESSQQQGFGQALVFTNSQHNIQMTPGTGNSTAVNSYSPQSLSSVLGSGFGELAPSKMANINSSQILDQLKTPSVSQFTTTQSSQHNNTSPLTTSSSWDLKPPASQPSVLSQFEWTWWWSKSADSRHSLSSHQSSLSSAHAALSSSTPHTIHMPRLLFCQHASVESTPSLQSSAPFSTAAATTSSATSSGANLPSSVNTGNSLCLNGATMSAPISSTRTAPLVTSGKAPPNLPQGVPPLLHNQYLMGPGGLLPAYPMAPRCPGLSGDCVLSSIPFLVLTQIYGYDELQMLQSRLPVDYYGIPFATPTALASRDGSLANNPYSGDVTKFGRGDSASPAPPSTLAQPQQSQSQTHHTAQPFLNPALPPGYSYTGLPYYTGVPSAFQYGPTVFVPPATAKQHGVNLSTPTPPFQQAGGYGQHSYTAGYDDLTQGTAAGDYTKGGYSGSSQAQNKSAGSGPGKGLSVSSSTTGLPDMTGSVYKTQTFDKQGFHAGTPPPFSLPSALGSTGPVAPGAAPGYAPPPFLHILPAHQQPHSQLLHHHLPQDAQSGSGQRSQPSSLQPKTQASKPAYSNSPYWTN
ncbi:ubiquitin-associated protein 2 isoform X10 [Choloepus didactylus]|uniref:ubiquitin-associated protein 2 isoform X10 n=1 Tax=Choloepus didactylus TaxID=27675 RepID=UPI00189EC7A6|nr:ubiquitin-associated protein 2 isoform X10 [Choloepus didactylus]